MADPIVIRYTGNPGDHHAGVPARDLSLAEFDALSEEQQATVRASAIYDYAAAVEQAKGRKAAKDDDKKADSKA